MTTTGQLALDLWGPDLTTYGWYVRHTTWVSSHRVAPTPLPHDTATLGSAGDPAPTWRCCSCGRAYLTPYALHTTCGCRPVKGGCANDDDDEEGWTPCQRTPIHRTSPPPTGADGHSAPTRR